MSLNEKQFRFSIMLADLILEAHHRGYQIVVKEVWRHPVMAAWYAVRGLGVRDSFHGKSLAVDLALFRGGVYLTATKDYEPLGLWWIGVGGTWGGKFKRADGNHFSLGE